MITIVDIKDELKKLKIKGITGKKKDELIAMLPADHPYRSSAKKKAPAAAKKIETPAPAPAKPKTPEAPTKVAPSPPMAVPVADSLETLVRQPKTIKVKKMKAVAPAPAAPTDEIQDAEADVLDDFDKSYDGWSQTENKKKGKQFANSIIACSKYNTYCRKFYLELFRAMKYLIKIVAHKIKHEEVILNGAELNFEKHIMKEVKTYGVHPDYEGYIFDVKVIRHITLYETEDKKLQKVIYGDAIKGRISISTLSYYSEKSGEGDGTDEEYINIFINSPEDIAEEQKMFDAHFLVDYGKSDDILKTTTIETLLDSIYKANYKQLVEYAKKQGYPYPLYNPTKKYTTTLKNETVVRV